MARHSVLSTGFALLAAAGALRTISLGFAAASPKHLRSVRTARRAADFTTGKVNLGVEIEIDAPSPAIPVIECDVGCLTAIFDCLEDGCSVEAMMKLDTKLAEDEAKIAASLAEIKNLQKTAYSEENTGTLAWLASFLRRTGGLRAQLLGLKGNQDDDFVKQMLRAASVAFGGSRHSDYPKVGVSPYSVSP